MEKVLKLFESGVLCSEVMDSIQTILDAGLESIKNAPQWAKKDETLAKLCELDSHDLMMAMTMSLEAVERLCVLNEMDAMDEYDECDFCERECDDCDCHDCEDDDYDDDGGFGPCIVPECNKELNPEFGDIIAVSDDNCAVLVRMKCENGHEGIGMYELEAIFEKDTPPEDCFAIRDEYGADFFDYDENDEPEDECKE